MTKTLWTPKAKRLSRRLAVRLGQLAPETDFMVRCPRGHFIADARKVGRSFIFSAFGMADAYCVVCGDDVAVDGREQMERLRRAFDLEEAVNPATVAG